MDIGETALCAVSRQFAVGAGRDVNYQSGLQRVFHHAQRLQVNVQQIEHQAGFDVAPTSTCPRRLLALSDNPLKVCPDATRWSTWAFASNEDIAEKRSKWRPAPCKVPLKSPRP